MRMVGAQNVSEYDLFSCVQTRAIITRITVRVATAVRLNTPAVTATLTALMATMNKTVVSKLA